MTEHNDLLDDLRFVARFLGGLSKKVAQFGIYTDTSAAIRHVNQVILDIKRLGPVEQANTTAGLE